MASQLLYFPTRTRNFTFLIAVQSGSIIANRCSLLRDESGTGIHWYHLVLLFIAMSFSTSSLQSLFFPQHQVRLWIFRDGPLLLQDLQRCIKEL